MVVTEVATRTGRAGSARGRSDAGFTMIELMFTIMLFGLLVVIGAGPWSHYRAKQEHRGATRELVAFLRRAQVRAVAEETTYRVDIAADGLSAKTYRLDGTTFVAGQQLETPSKRVSYTTPVFTSSSGSGASIYFFARGSASKGSLTVAREGSDEVFTIQVEGLTARVSYTD